MVWVDMNKFRVQLPHEGQTPQPQPSTLSEPFSDTPGRMSKTVLPLRVTSALRDSEQTAKAWGRETVKEETIISYVLMSFLAHLQSRGTPP